MPTEKEQEEKLAKRSGQIKEICAIIETRESHYKKNEVSEDVRNLSYYRGQFWAGDGVFGEDAESGYTAQQNEIFPIVDTMVSALAMDIPAVELVDRRVRRGEPPDRTTDDTLVGLGLAAVLNWWAELDELDVSVQQWVLCSILFRYGVMKVSWSPSKGRPIFRAKLPWEVFFDPGAKRVEDATWAFERFPMHIDDLRARQESGQYEGTARPIVATSFPRHLVEEEMKSDSWSQLKAKGLQKYVSLVEFYDFRLQKLFHIHPDTKQVLLEADLPHGNPYVLLSFHEGVGRIEGVSDVSLLAPMQRDINELVSSRREMVSRLPRRLMVDEGFFGDDIAFERLLNAKTYDAVKIPVPAGRRLQDGFYMTPEMPTTFDFNQALASSTDSVRRVGGFGDYARGGVKNIRTAAEADMIRSSVDGRLSIRMRKVVRGVTQLFSLAHRSWQWAIENPNASQIDMDKITFATQADVTPEQLAQEALEQSPKFNILPFSPLMEDKIARRGNLVELLQSLQQSPGLGDSINMRELTRELVDAFGWRPSIVKSEQLIQEEQAQAQAAEAAAAAPAVDPAMAGGDVVPEGIVDPTLTTV